MGPWLKHVLVFEDFEGYFGVISVVKMIITRAHRLTKLIAE